VVRLEPWRCSKLVGGGEDRHDQVLGRVRVRVRVKVRVRVRVRDMVRGRGRGRVPAREVLVLGLGFERSSPYP
jgi:hypothetical protein